MLVKKSLRQGTVTKTTGRLSKQGRAFPLMKKCHSLCDLAFSEMLTKSHSGHTSTSLQHKSDYLRDAYINALKVIKCSSSRGTSMLKQNNLFFIMGSSVVDLSARSHIWNQQLSYSFNCVYVGRAGDRLWLLMQIKSRSWMLLVVKMGRSDIVIFKWQQ